MRVRINVLACVLTATAAVAAVAAAYAGHRWQVRRHAGGLLTLAQAAEERGRPDRAAGLYLSYLALAPADTAARAQYGLLLESMARGGKDLGVVVGVFEQVLAENPGRADVRERLARAYAGAGRPDLALPHLFELKADAAPDAGLAFLLGECLEANGDLPGARTQYQRSLGIDPKPIGRALRLAVLCRKIGGPAVAQADEAVEQMLAANPGDGLAHLARARYRLTYRAGDAGPDLDAAVRLAPTSPDVRLTAAEADPPKALDHLRAALAAAPRDERVYVALAGAEARGPGGPAAAAALLRRGLASSPGSERLLVAMAEVQLLAGDGLGAERYVAELERWKRAPEQVVVLRGRAKMAAGDWRAALAALDAGRPGLAASSGDLATTADVLTGRCREQVGEDDLALTAYRRAVAAAPRRTDAQEGVARALVRLGRLGEAVEYYRQLTADSAAAPAVWLLYARLRTVEYLSRPPTGRRPGDLDAVLADAEKRLPASVDLLLLRAEAQVADGRPDEARRALREECAKRPADTALWLALARLAIRLGDRAEAERVFAGMGGANDPDWHAARLAVLPSDGPRAEAALRDAEAVAGGQGAPEARFRLVGALAEAYGVRKAWADARRWWLEAARLRPADIGVWFRVFEVGVQANDRAQMEEAVRAVRRAEGVDGVFGHFAEALLRFARPEDRSPAGYREAREHLLAAGLSRPTWASVPAARAVVAELEGRPDEALTEYMRAVELGDRRAAVVRRSVQLLCGRRRYPEAERLIQQAQAQQSGRDPLDRLAAEVSIHTLDVRRAVELAGSAVAPTSLDYTDHLWKAEILSAAGRPDEATAALRRAVEVAGPVGAPRVALVAHLTRTGKADEAGREIAALSRGLTGTELEVTTAQCLEVAGRGRDAADAFRKALAARPEDAELVRQAAAFFERFGDPGAAAPALRQLLGTRLAPADQVWVRRALAGALTADHRYAAFREAVALLDQNLATDPTGPTDRLAKARALATRLAHRREALALLDDVRRRHPLSADDDFFRGQLLADTGAWADGRRLMVDVVSRGDARPQQTLFLIDRLLQHDQPADAAFWIDRLDAATAGRPAVTRLRAAAQAKQGRAEDAVAGLRKMVPVDVSKPDDRDRVRAVAETADAVALEASLAGGPLGALADELFSRAAAGGRPADRLAQAAHLGRRGQVDPALAECRAAAGADPLTVASTLVGILYTSHPLSDGQLATVEREALDYLDRAGPSPGRESLLGTVHARRGRYTDAAAAFGRLVTAGGGAEAMNNQAYMLVLAGDPARAAELADAALAETGPSPGLLDTRGSARLAAGRVAEAVADAETAVDQEPTAVRCLHMADAYQRAGRPTDALAALARSAKLRPTAAAFLPAEQIVFDRVTMELRASR